MDELGADAEAARTRLAIAAAYLEVGPACRGAGGGRGGRGDHDRGGHAA
jgi:hypothetical protein